MILSFLETLATLGVSMYNGCDGKIALLCPLCIGTFPSLQLQFNSPLLLGSLFHTAIPFLLATCSKFLHFLASIYRYNHARPTLIQLVQKQHMLVAEPA